jgi:hypothetical protein
MTQAPEDRVVEALVRLADPFTGVAPGSLRPGESWKRDIAENALSDAEALARVVKAARSVLVQRIGLLDLEELRESLALLDQEAGDRVKEEA